KEMFAAHFFPEQHQRGAWFRKSLEYYLAVLFFNAFPLPQREAGARQTLRYIGELLGEKTSVLIFPEGHRSETGEIHTFRPGIGMIASRLDATVVPVRIVGLDKVLPVGSHMGRQGTVVAVHSGGLDRVQCDAGHEVLAQLSGRMRRFRIKVVPGDRVTVGVSPYDPVRGIITFRAR